MRFIARLFGKSMKRLCCSKCTFAIRLTILLLVIGGWAMINVRTQLTLYKNPLEIFNDNQPIDVVYTWVNGSDPEFIREIQQYDRNYDPSRFHDKNELKYSLRSLAKYAPWIRNVYILTNGQIPNWLDLEHPHVLIISHKDLWCNDAAVDNILPTFSSATIETFLHKIPNLSERFLYMNDDIFLGEPLHIDDLYTTGGGVKIFTAWSVPNCAAECPWVYIGDGMCDEECNRIECKFDDGDCDSSSQPLDSYSIQWKSSNIKEANHPKPLKSISSNKSTNSGSEFIKILNAVAVGFGSVNNSVTTIAAIAINRTDNGDVVKNIVQTFNEQQKLRQKRLTRKRRKKNYATISNISSNTSNLNEKIPLTITGTGNGQSSKDMFARSLIYTNNVINKMYGFKARKVIAHVGLLLEKQIINEMLQKHSIEFKQTQVHRTRHPYDMQFSFSYYHHLMLQNENITLSEIFDKFDTDKSGSWSDREIRTLLTRIFPLPLRWDAVRFFENIILNCSAMQQEQQSQETESIKTTLLYERYEDSNIPKVSKNLIINCAELATILRIHFGTRPKYKFTIETNSWAHSNFKMLTSNLAQVVDALDELRRSPKKFNCINDNMNFQRQKMPELMDNENNEHQNQYQLSDENQLIIGLLDDFYLSLFPERSPYELPDNLRNRFATIKQYRRWMANKRNITHIIYGLCASVFILMVVYRILIGSGGILSSYRYYRRRSFCSMVALFFIL